MCHAIIARIAVTVVVLTAVVGLAHASTPGCPATHCAFLPVLWQVLHPYSAGGAYVNMMMDEGQERVQAPYRDNYARLAAIKATYDSHNLFRVNQNIRPAEQQEVRQ